MFNKRHNVSSFGGAGVSGVVGNLRWRQSAINATIVRNNNADEGVVAFGLWLYDEERSDSQVVPITMKELHQDEAALLRDNILQKDITVRIANGVPFCNDCWSDNCIHVGFVVCAEQMQRRSRLE